MMRGTARARVAGRRPFTLGALAKRVHQIDDLGRLALARHLDLLAVLFLAQQFFQRIFIVVFEFFRIEVPGCP